MLLLSACVEVTEPDFVEVPDATVLDQKGALHREVWKTVYDYYYDPEFNGIDWVEVGRETSVSLKDTTDVESIYAVLKEMVGALNDRHTYILSPKDYSEFQTAEFVGVGLTTSHHDTMEDVDIVMRVAPGSSAESAGIEPGWLLLNGSVVLEQSIPLGSSEVFRFLDHYEQVREIKLEARKLPKTATQRESRVLESQILYLRFDFFEKGIAQWVSEELELHPQAEALIFDVRWNPGGYKSELTQIFNFILPENSNIGIGVTRKKQLNYEFTSPKYSKPASTMPIAVLVSPYSASSSEILAAVVKYHERGKVFGTGATAGEVLFSPGWELPAGGLLKIAARDYLTPAGDRLQDHGVEPDVKTQARSFFEFRRGLDPTIDAAVASLKSEIGMVADISKK